MKENDDVLLKKVENLAAQDFFAYKWAEINGVELSQDEVLNYTDIFDKGVEKMVDELGFSLIEKKLEALKSREDTGEKLKRTDAWNRRHLEKSVKIIKDWQEKGNKTLFEALNVDGARNELEELRAGGDLDKITKKELEIVDKIKQGVGLYPQVEQSQDSSREDQPSEILKNQEFNCVGASIVGEKLLERAGIKNFPAEVYHHATNVVVTSDNNIHITDMRWSIISKKLEDTDFKDASLEDILSFEDSDYPSLNIHFSEEQFSNIKSFWHEEGVKDYFSIRKNDLGSQLVILMNYLKELHFKEGRTDVAIEACKYAEILDPENPSIKEHMDLLLAKGTKECIDFDSDIMKDVFYIRNDEQASFLAKRLKQKIKRDGKKFKSQEDFKFYLEDVNERLHNLDYINEIFETGDKVQIKEYQEYAEISPEKVDLMEYYAKLRKELIDKANLELARRELNNPEFDNQDKVIGIYKENIERHVRDVVYAFNKAGLKTVFSGFLEMEHQSIGFKEDYLEDFQFNDEFLLGMKKQGVVIEIEPNEIVFEMKKKFSVDELTNIWNGIGREVLKNII